MSQLPHSKQAEEAVIGQILADPKVLPSIIGSLLAPQHFYLASYKLLFEEIAASYYADDPIDPVTIGEATGKKTAKLWDCTEEEAVTRVQELAKGQRAFTDEAPAHAETVKKHADLRALLDLAASIERNVEAETRGPDEIAGMASQTAMEIATSSLLTHDILSFGDLGRHFIRQIRTEVAARQQGVELGAYFGLPFIDDYVRGLRPTELMIGGGEPGVGKSAVYWKAAMNFAERQADRSPDEQIATLVLSLEMGEEPTNVRLAQGITGIDGGRMREGDVDEPMIQKVISEWGKRKDLPLYFNFTSTLKASQLRALIVEGIRRHNVGLVVIDHFRYFDMDDKPREQNQHDDEKVRFLKESLAKELNLAVICIAHTTKSMERADKRPRLSDLRGSGQISADADFVGFVYRPIIYASQKQIDEGRVMSTDAELLWEKNRHGRTGAAQFFFDPTVMRIE